MPVYEYRCDNGHEFEVLQRMSESSLTECKVCGAPVQRVFHAPAIHFKGSGFYNTDYGKKRGGGSSETDGGNGGGEGKSEKKADGASKSGDGGGSGSSGSSDSKSSSSDLKSSSTKAPEAA